MTGRFWTTAELELVRENYPKGGVEACLPHVQRNRQSIYQKAAAMGLHAPGRSGVHQHWPQDAYLDARIKRLHETPLLRGAIVAFAESIGRPVWWVSRRARGLGLKTPRFKELPWTPEEIDILHDTAHLTPTRAQLTLRRKGYTRSETAIVVKRKREDIRLAMAKQDAGIYNSNQLAELFGVDRKTPVRWVTLDGLRGAKHGDLWQVRERDLRAFIIEHPFRVELRKIPAAHQAWFIELLTGRAGTSSGKAP